MPLICANWNMKLFWHTLFLRFSFVRTSEMTEFTVFAAVNFVFSFMSQKSQNKWHETLRT